MKNKNNLSSIVLWPGGKTLSLINGEQTLSNLKKNVPWVGLTEPITDGHSINVRQDGLKLFTSSRSLRNLELTSLPSLKSSNDFFINFGSQSDFNQKVDKIRNLLKHAITKSTQNLRTNTYQDLLKQLDKTHDHVKQQEDMLASKLKVHLKDVFAYQGEVTVSTPLENYFSKEKTKITSDVYGVREFAFSEEWPWFCRLARWFRKSFFETNWGKEFANTVDDNRLGALVAYGIIGLVQLCLIGVLFIPLFIPAFIITEWAEKHHTDTLFTTTMPITLETVFFRLQQSILSEFNSLIDSDLQKLKEKDVKINEIKNLISFSNTFSFTLTPEHGLQVKLIDTKYVLSPFTKVGLVEQINGDEQNLFDLNLFNKGKTFYSRMMEAKFKKKAAQQSYKIAERFLKNSVVRLLTTIVEEYKERLEVKEKQIFEDNYTSIFEEVQYAQLREAIIGCGLEDAWQVIQTTHGEIVSLMNNLYQIQALANRVIEVKEKYDNISIEFPDVVSDDHNIVEFTDVTPVHLIGTKKFVNSEDIMKASDLRIIGKLPSLNGQMVSITGKNGGGKTVTEIALINNLYLAHMGFPVFAKEFRFNAKEIIAVVFVEKGEGSMLQLLMEKLTRVAEAVNENPNNKIVVIMDELLTGTQEKSGLSIGKKYLKMLADKKCSVLFVTQITQLAEYAKDNLNALAYHYDQNGDLKKGIGTGHAEQLADEVGLTEYLNN